MSRGRYGGIIVMVVLVSMFTFISSACRQKADNGGSSKLSDELNEENISGTVDVSEEAEVSGGERFSDEQGNPVVNADDRNEETHILETSDRIEIKIDKAGMIDINISVGNQVFYAKFYDNESVRAIISEMPFALEMEDYASQEKVTALPFTLPSASVEIPVAINVGDIYLWSGNSLVLFYTSFSNAYSYVPVGYIVDTADLRNTLGSGSVTVSFDVAE